jgi:isopenicillin N synthase-like dioxygenase
VRAEFCRVARKQATLPGLYIWTRGGERLQVRVPPGALLIQAGAQLEHLTGGEIARGFHEVVVSEAAVAAVAAARAEGRSLWRVSLTFFAHCGSDESLAPVGPFAAAAGAAKYDVLAGDLVAAELKAISLADDAT